MRSTAQTKNKKMKILYELNKIPDLETIVHLYDSSGLNRPTADYERISNMYENSNLVVTAWDKDTLVGIARSLTDFCYRC